MNYDIGRNPLASRGTLTRRLAALENEWVRNDKRSVTSLHVPSGHCAVFQDFDDSSTDVIDSGTFGPVSHNIVNGYLLD